MSLDFIAPNRSYVRIGSWLSLLGSRVPFSRGDRLRKRGEDRAMESYSRRSRRHPDDRDWIHESLPVRDGIDHRVDDGCRESQAEEPPPGILPAIVPSQDERAAEVAHRSGKSPGVHDRGGCPRELPVSIKPLIKSATPTPTTARSTTVPGPSGPPVAEERAGAGRVAISGVLEGPGL